MVRFYRFALGYRFALDLSFRVRVGRLDHSGQPALRCASRL